MMRTRKRTTQWIGLLSLIAVTLIGSHGASADQANPVKLQQLVDDAKSGDLVKLPPGQYEGPVVIKKKIRLVAEGEALLINRSSKPALRIQADDVQVTGLHVVQESSAEQSAAVLVSASGAKLDGLRIQTRAYGIMLRDANRNDIQRTRIDWVDEPGRPPAKMSEKRNGIDLFNSHDNRIRSNEVSGMNDGIYLESSHRSTVENNRIEHSRYGVHCMYTEGTMVRGNIGAYNVTGAMVMGVKDAEVSGNTFFKQSENVNSQGLLLFDVQTSRIHGNQVEGNRVGLYIEQSQNNELYDNNVLRNFVGIQLLESDGNRFTNNNFIGNVIEAEATDSVNNTLKGNFWDSFRGIDLEGDGLSDIQYGLNPFFQRLTAAVPAFQLFFQSPGMSFLENMFTSDQTEWASDQAPLMHPASNSQAASGNAGSGATLAVSLMLFLISIFIIYYAGVRRT